MSVPATLAVVTLPVVRALLDQAHSKSYRGGVVGIRAQPTWDGPVDFEHAGRPVRVAPCTSVLAVREAMLTRGRDRWLVVLTDRADAELGAGVRAHLVGHRLRTPDPWDAVRSRFSASTIEAALASGPGSRELAVGVLTALAAVEDCSPAPGGVLTREHLLRSTAEMHLGLPPPGVPLDAAMVLAWSSRPGSPERVAALRTLAGDALVDALLSAMSNACAAAGPAVRLLLCRGALVEVVPLGLVVDVLLSARNDDIARAALVRLEPTFGGALPPAAALLAWTQECRGLLAVTPDADRLLRAADGRLSALQAGALVEGSDLLPGAVGARLLRLAETMRNGLLAPDLDAVERAWERVQAHRMAGADQRVRPFEAAVRLMRWLTLDAAPVEPTLPALVARHSTSDAWVDAATSDAAQGTADPELGSVLATVLVAVRGQRAPHDAVFAEALAAATLADDLYGLTGLENLLPDRLLPLARQQPLLLLVCDGMSAAVAAEVISSVTAPEGDGWLELLPPGATRRGSALAVLPTLTVHSRASLLCGELTSGEQPRERAGFAALCAAHGLVGELFHKKALDETPPGQAVAPLVDAALADISGRHLVACVLNTIDDSLDRSDPGGTHWGLGTIKHLRPLLERARSAGRIVVLTSDHGHVIERRQGRTLPVASFTSGRSRTPAPPAGVGEVFVQGRRVHGDRAVLAVDEQVRYGPLKAGYHGGAAPAEVVVPVIVLTAGAIPAGWQAAGPQEPAWWWTSPGAAPAGALPLTLFDDSTRPTPGAAVAAAVLVSAVYVRQRARAGRVAVRDEQVRDLLVALLDAPGHRLAPQPAARALGEAPTRMRGAVPQVQQLLNVEGYAVLRPDADGVTLLLDAELLREQFDLR